MSRLAGCRLWAAAWLVAAFAGIAGAQTSDPLKIPHVAAEDENGVGLVSGFTRLRLTDLTIGSGDMTLSHTVIGPRNAAPRADFRDSLKGGSGGGGQYATFSACSQTAESQGGWSPGWGEQFECFIPENGGWRPEVNRGSTLVAAGGKYVYTTSTGEEATIDPNLLNQIVRLRYPNGWTLDYHYVGNRLQTITTNNGLQIIYAYASDSVGSAGYNTVTRVTGVNNAYDYCPTNISSCATTRPWPTATYSMGTNTYSITDFQGGVTRYTFDSRGRVTAVKPANSAVNILTFTHCNGYSAPSCLVSTPDSPTYIPLYDWVYSANNNGRAFSYALTLGIGGRYNEYKSTGSDTEARAFSYTGTPGVSFLEYIEKDDTVVDYTHGGTRISSIAEPRGNLVGYGYDARLNVISATRHAVPGTNLAPLATIAYYEPGCATQRTCNQPLWVQDPNGNRTDYTYDPAHGGVLIETRPAVNGVRPQTRYTYAQRYAWFRNSAGTYVRAATPIWVRTQESFCRTSSATGSPAAPCTTAGDEVRTDYDYGPDSGPNNLFLRGRVVTADGQSLRTCYGYDHVGNRISETQPNAERTSCP